MQVTHPSVTNLSERYTVLSLEQLTKVDDCCHCTNLKTERHFSAYCVTLFCDTAERYFVFIPLTLFVCIFDSSVECHILRGHTGVPKVGHYQCMMVIHLRISCAQLHPIQDLDVRYCSFVCHAAECQRLCARFTMKALEYRKDI